MKKIENSFEENQERLKNKRTFDFIDDSKLVKIIKY